MRTNDVSKSSNRPNVERIIINLLQERKKERKIFAIDKFVAVGMIEWDAIQHELV